MRRRRTTTGGTLVFDRHGDIVDVEADDPIDVGELRMSWQSPRAQTAPELRAQIEYFNADGSTLAVNESIPDDDMQLPTDATCGDCASFQRCSWLVDADRHSTSCDWSPSRFRRRSP